MHSVPRLMPGQGVHRRRRRDRLPGRVRGRRPADARASSASSKIITLTNTYDHRIIQGAESGEFLRRDPRAAARRATASTTRSSASLARSLRAGALDRATAAALDASLAAHEKVVARPPAHQHVPGARPPHREPRPARADRSRSTHPELDIDRTTTSRIWDLDREFPIGSLGAGRLGRDACRCATILGVLRDAYARTIGVEYMHIQEPDQKEWIQEHVEAPQRRRRPATSKRRILERLNAAEAFERFLHTKYLGQKRFSLEGAETPDPDARRAARPRRRRRHRRGRDRHGAPRPPQRARQRRRQVVRADLPRVRGRARPDAHAGLRRREVPPRRRPASTRRRAGTTVRLTLAANPSHLEAVDPVVEGMARAQAATACGDAEHDARAAGARPRRRRVRRPGRRRRDAQPLGARRATTSAAPCTSS